MSTTLIHKIEERMDDIIQIRVNIEQSLKNKELSLQSVNRYEKQRIVLFAQSLQAATQSTLNTLEVLKDISNQLKLVKQVP